MASVRIRSASRACARLAAWISPDWDRSATSDFKRVIATLRLAVPYTGLILTARENAPLRRELMKYGVSQIDAGSRIEIGGYTEKEDTQLADREQFELGDIRSLDKVMRELMQDGYVPSFCTACYRLGRTGEHFMEFAIPGIHQTLLHAERHFHADGVPGGLCVARDSESGRSADTGGTERSLNRVR